MYIFLDGGMKGTMAFKNVVFPLAVPPATSMVALFSAKYHMYAAISIDIVPNLIKSIAQSFGGDADVKWKVGYPVGFNDKKMKILDYGGGNGKLMAPFIESGHECFFLLLKVI